MQVCQKALQNNPSRLYSIEADIFLESPSQTLSGLSSLFKLDLKEQAINEIVAGSIFCADAKENGNSN